MRWVALHLGGAAATLSGFCGVCLGALPPTGLVPAGVSPAPIGAALMAIGLTLTLVAALGRGFSTLDRFFGEVLRRTSRAPAAAAAAPDVVEAGLLGGRPFRRFADGGVEVETVFGPRRFEDVASAQAFVGVQRAA